MDGLECSEVLLSYLIKSNDIFRIDSSFFVKKYLLYEERLSTFPHTTVSKTGAEIKSFGAYSLNNEVEYVPEGIPFIRCLNIKEGFVNDTNMLFITPDAHELLWKSEVQPNTFLLTMSGTIGNAAIADDNLSYPVNSNQDIAKIRFNGKYSNQVALAFFMSRYGSYQIEREARGSVQQHVFLSQVETLRLPCFCDSLVTALEHCVKQAYSLRKQSQEVYEEVQTTLEEHLGLSATQEPEATISVELLTQSFGITGRLDAEYYQPRYKKIEHALRSYDPNTKTLADIAEYIFTGEYADEYLHKSSSPNLRHFVRGTDINNGYIEADDNICIDPVGFSKFVSSGDILTGRVGTIGKFGVVDESLNHALCSDNILCFHLPQQYMPNVYALYFNNSIIRCLITRLARGSVQQRLNQETLREILVPLIREDTQKLIDRKITQSFALRKKSERILELTTQAVEYAIECGEGQAIDWLDRQMRELEV